MPQDDPYGGFGGGLPGWLPYLAGPASGMLGGLYGAGQAIQGLPSAIQSFGQGVQNWYGGMGSPGQAPQNQALNPSGRTDVPYQYPNPPATGTAGAGAGAGAAGGAGVGAGGYGAQPYGGGTGGTAGAGGTVGGTAPAPNAQAAMNPTADITDPNAAVMAQIMQLGINPLAGGPWVKAVLGHAADLVNSIKAQAALNPSGDILSNPTNLAAAVKNIVSGALGGQNVLYTGAAGSGMADVVRSVLGGVTPGAATNTADQNILATMMQDPASAANLINTLLYGGTTAPYRGAAGDWTKLLPTIMANYQWQYPGQFPSAAPGAPTSAPSLLDLLPQLRSFKYNPATSGQGVSQPAGMPTGQ